MDETRPSAPAPGGAPRPPQDGLETETRIAPRPPQGNAAPAPWENAATVFAPPPWPASPSSPVAPTGSQSPPPATPYAPPAYGQYGNAPPAPPTPPPWQPPQAVQQTPPSYGQQYGQQYAQPSPPYGHPPPAYGATPPPAAYGQPAPYQYAPPGPPAPAPSGPAFDFNGAVRRLRLGDLLAVGGGTLFLLAKFLPFASVRRLLAGFAYSLELNGWQATNGLWNLLQLALCLALADVALDGLTARLLPLAQLPKGIRYLIIGAALAATTLFGLVGITGVSSGPFACLLFALAVVAGGLLKMGVVPGDGAVTMASLAAPRPTNPGPQAYPPQGYPNQPPQSSGYPPPAPPPGGYGGTPPPQSPYGAPPAYGPYGQPPATPQYGAPPQSPYGIPPPPPPRQ